MNGGTLHQPRLSTIRPRLELHDVRTGEPEAEAADAVVVEDSASEATFEHEGKNSGAMPAPVSVTLRMRSTSLA